MTRVKMLEQVEMFSHPFPITNQTEVNQMALKKGKKGKKVVKKVSKKAASTSSKKSSENEAEVSDKKQIVLHIDPRLHGAAKITAQALGTNLSKVLRKLLAEWITQNKKKAMSYLDQGATFDEDEDVEEEEVEDEDVEEEEEEESEEESEDEEEEESEEEEEEED